MEKQMPTIAKNSSSVFEQAPTGMQQAVCVFVNDIGNQVQTFAGEERILHKVVITWELAEKQTNGEPFLVSKFYTLSLNEKSNLRKDLESWRGRSFTDEELENGFDVERLIGANCFLNITTNDKGRSVISAVNPLPKGIEKIRPTVLEMPPNFQKWIESMRAKSVTPAEHTIANSVPPPDDADLPF
jgi:hypothetical protein